jgi:hypothetical protein
MNIPGFTAEASLNKRARYYLRLRGTPLIDDGRLLGQSALRRFCFALSLMIFRSLTTYAAPAWRAAPAPTILNV